MDEKRDISTEFVHLARLALTGRTQDVQLLLRRVARGHQHGEAGLASEILQLLQEAPTRSSPLRRHAAPTLPVDLDSRLQLLRCEQVHQLDVEPIFESHVRQMLDQVVAERRSANTLASAGLTPSRSILFIGPPGVGKSLAARWLARELHLPLLVLDLAAVMSSFLGRTGNNLRHVLDFAKDGQSILLLDELDAIAKRRADVTEIGELKRLVTVLLQEIDDWPPNNLLIAATNHPDLLDPAVWRRFDMLVEFPMPNEESVSQAVERFLGTHACALEQWKRALAVALRGSSFSDIERTVMRARRAVALQGDDALPHFEDILRSLMASRDHDDRVALASELVGSQALSQRQAYALTGVSRDTIRKYLREDRSASRSEGRVKSDA